MQQSNDQLKAQVEELLRENESLKLQFLERKQENEQLQTENESIKLQFKELQQELDNVATPPPPDYLAVRDSVLKSLTSGKGKIATTSPQYRTTSKALDKFIASISGVSKKGQPSVVPSQHSTQISIP